MEAAPADGTRHDADEPMLATGVPRKQREGHGVEYIGHGRDLLRLTLDDDTPGFSRSRVVPVYFESDLRARDRGGELRALAGAENDGSVIDEVVDRENIWTVGGGNGKPAYLGAAHQLPAGVDLKDDNTGPRLDSHAQVSPCRAGMTLHRGGRLIAYGRA
jgi:hypothetical protein